MRKAISIFLFTCLALRAWSADEIEPLKTADLWRSQHLIIDLHQHIDCTTQRLARAVKIMDAVGVGIGVNLTPGTVTPGPNGGPSEFEQCKKLADALYPGRFLQYMNLDYADWDQPDFS